MTDPGVRRVLVTRPPDRWPRLRERFARGPVVLEFRPTAVPADPADPAAARRVLARAGDYAFLVVTSGTAAAALGRTLAALRLDLPPGVRVAAVGPATGRALASAGLRVDLLPSDPRGAGLAREIAAGMRAGERALLVGPEGGGAAAPALRAAGVPFDEAAVYRTVASGEAPALARETIAGRFAGVAFTAPSSLDLWLDASGPERGALEDALSRLVRIAIGPTTAARLAACGLSPQAVAEAPDEEAVGDAVARAFDSG